MIQFVDGNRITLLENGTDYFPALEAAIDRAVREVYLETYIFEDDRTGQQIAAALKRAARRGVTTHLLLDGYGTKDLPRERIDDMRSAGVQVLIYRPVLAKFRRSSYRRLHRKIVVVDNRTAFVGGINIIDDMDTPNQTPPRYDYAVSLEGPLVQAVHATARKLWGLVAWSQLKRRRRRQQRAPLILPFADGVSAALVLRDNINHRRDIEDAYLDAIDQARGEVIVANAYFLPGRRFRQALISASRRGVKVTLLLQGRVEYLLLHYATRALYGVFLDAGIEIYEYHRSFLHAKVAVVDGIWATVGSSNIDPFSLLLSREANVVVNDADFSVRLKGSLVRAMDEGSRVVTYESWKRQPLYLRLMSWLSYGSVRLLMGVAGYGRMH
ncbi:MAG: cardiolipin synthase ClsB [Sulfurimicrobium sp.]|nr:cardiolipin synthase ClsB [Sulfurimicrobium sp.]MDP1898542.1 cardiolipin synthase ClsB [Sulfurimicrobium sp.]MDP2197794.1 cardiolipin synthase ClsB [Sulfurimicrobium sp.]MDP3688404.1 cardiolipin synthase ClsB [Sulfurimicrobium sp.]MDZ7654469.1 cardiolipin synthase ClsB [Sulfurimicrobium sp.]